MNIDSTRGRVREKPPRSLRALAVAALATLAAFCTGQSHSADFGQATIGAVGSAAAFPQLAGWSNDATAAAVPAFLKSCARLAKRPDTSPLDPALHGARFGTVADWRPLCEAAAALPTGDDRAARQFFETRFVPVAASGGEGIITGYYEVELAGSRTRGGSFQTPVYRRPADLVMGRPYALDRGAIEDGALTGRGLELIWLKDPDDLLVLQTQGSGRIHLTDGSTIRLVYDANNGRPPVSVENLVMQRGLIPPASFSNAAVRAWMRLYPEKARAIRRENTHYVFFREHSGDGPIGYQGAVLTPERSLAVDHSYVPLGVPVWLEARGKYRPDEIKRLVVAQDIGDGITGPMRGDYYWGSGAEAQRRGGDFYASGRYYLLLPRTVAARQLAAR